MEVWGGRGDRGGGVVGFCNTQTSHRWAVLANILMVTVSVLCVYQFFDLFLCPAIFEHFTFDTI